MFLPQKIVVAPNQAAVTALQGQAVVESYLTHRQEPLQVGKLLFMGDKVRCLKGVLILSEFGKIIQLKPSPTWHTIYRANPPLRKYIRPLMGRAGASGPQIFSYPLDDTMVIPDRFYLRWDDYISSDRNIQVWVRSGDEILWPPKNTKAFLPHDKKEWIPKDLQAVLIQKQRENFGAGLQLVWGWDLPISFNSDATEFRIVGTLDFRLLDVNRDQELKAAFREMERNFDPLTLVLYQIPWLEKNHLWADEADAYETAVRLAPTRFDIKEAAIDFLRAHSLNHRASRLEPGLFGF